LQLIIQKALLRGYYTRQRYGVGLLKLYPFAPAYVLQVIQRLVPDADEQVIFVVPNIRQFFPVLPYTQVHISNNIFTQLIVADKGAGVAVQLRVCTIAKPLKGFRVIVRNLLKQRIYVYCQISHS
jgi:hypothetical protein